MRNPCRPKSIKWFIQYQYLVLFIQIKSIYSVSSSTIIVAHKVLNRVLREKLLELRIEPSRASVSWILSFAARAHKKVFYKAEIRNHALHVLIHEVNRDEGRAIAPSAQFCMEYPVRSAGCLPARARLTTGIPVSSEICLAVTDIGHIGLRFCVYMKLASF